MRFGLLAACIVSLLASGCGGGGDAQAPAVAADTAPASDSASTGSTTGSSTGSTSSSSSGGSSTGGGTSTVSGAPPFPSASTPPFPGISLPGGTTVQTGTAAAIGAPTSTLFNGLATVLDSQFHWPNHAVVAAFGTLPAALAAENRPYFPHVRVLTRRDAVILYFSNVQGAADYRAYVINNSVSFISTAVGQEPRGAVIACAGFRQHTYESAVVNSEHQRELLQTVEIPGFVNNGNYTIVLEATSSPCPFVGMPAHTDATITGTDFNALDSSTYTYTGTHYAEYVSAATQLAKYGNEIINGQGAASSWPQRMTLPMGLVTTDPTIPSDPAVIARSAIAVQVPSADATVNAPVIDVGPNALEENFANDLVVDPSTYTVNPDYASDATAGGAPLFSIPGAWQFWGRYLQQVDGQTGLVNGLWSPTGMLGIQVFQAHGRLYTTFGDGGQDVGGAISFASLQTTPQQMDSTNYIHSMFRINTEASKRRYWTWTLCGGATAAELQDPTTHQYVIHPIFVETSFDGGITSNGSPMYYGDNPSVGHPTLGSVAPSQALNPAAKECLSLAEDGTPEYPRTDGNVRSSALIRAQIHPAGYAKGIIVLGNTASDPTSTPPGFRYKLDANQNYVGPMIEPWDQVSPLTHYDIFVRPDRLVVFINGREGFCVDMSERPLTMQYGMITYGDLLYHSALEWQNFAAPADGSGTPYLASQLYQVTLNQPIATTRAWDAVAQSEKIPIPPQFATFDPATCFKPQSTAIQ